MSIATGILTLANFANYMASAVAQVINGWLIYMLFKRVGNALFTICFMYAIWFWFFGCIVNPLRVYFYKKLVTTIKKGKKRLAI